MRKLFYRLTHGRPMICFCWAFTDTVSHKPVYLWADRFGRYWLAEKAWSLFRVRSEQPEAWLVERPKWSEFHVSNR